MVSESLQYSPLQICTHSENDNENEVDVGDVVQLKPQVLGHETDGCVFGRPDLVSLERLQRTALVIACFCRQSAIDIDCAMCLSLGSLIVGDLIALDINRIRGSRVALATESTETRSIAVEDGSPLVRALSSRFPYCGPSHAVQRLTLLGSAIVVRGWRRFIVVCDGHCSDSSGTCTDVKRLSFLPNGSPERQLARISQHYLVKLSMDLWGDWRADGRRWEGGMDAGMGVGWNSWS